MGRPARFIPENKNGVLVEVTCRTIGARALLVPSPDPRRFNEVVVGVLGRALEVSPLELCRCLPSVTFRPSSIRTYAELGISPLMPSPQLCRVRWFRTSKAQRVVEIH